MLLYTGKLLSHQVCTLRAQKQSADVSVEQERRNAERQVQFYLRKLDELRAYLTPGGSTSRGTGISNNGAGASCAVKDPCGGPASTTMAAAADQYLVGSLTKKLTKDIDTLSEKLKAEAKM